MAIKSAVEADHATAAMLLQMAGISARDESITLCEDVNGNLYEIPPFIINDPIVFINEKKHRIKPPEMIENELLKLKLRRPGNPNDLEIEIESKNPISDLKDEYASKEKMTAAEVKLYFGGKELQDANSIASYFIRNEMVLMVVIKSLS